MTEWIFQQEAIVTFRYEFAVVQIIATDQWRQVGSYISPALARATEYMPGALGLVYSHVGSPVAGEVMADKLFHRRISGRLSTAIDHYSSDHLQGDFVLNLKC